MPTAVDEDPPVQEHDTPFWRRLLPLVLGLVLIGGAAVAARTVWTREPPTGPLADQLAATVERLMETRFRTATTARPGRVVCAARAFGTDPARPADLAAVTTVYAWVVCRPAAPGAAQLATPVAIRLGQTPSIRIPERGLDRDRSIRRIFPPTVRDALHATPTDDLAHRVTREVD